MKMLSTLSTISTFVPNPCIHRGSERAGACFFWRLCYNTLTSQKTDISQYLVCNMKEYIPKDR